MHHVLLGLRHPARSRAASLRLALTAAAGVGLCALLSACGGIPARPAPGTGPVAVPIDTLPPRQGAGTLVHDTVFSPALRGNPLGDSPWRAVDVYLPASYARSPGRRYPVVYLLHGFDADEAWWTTRRVSVHTALDSLVAAGQAREAILVMPDAFNAYAGSFYANSPAMGRWGDFVARDLVSHVDRAYRTIPRPEGRALGGYSMGGYGAFTLGADHPGTFGLVYALSGCCLGGELLGDAGMADTTWARTLALRERGQVVDAPFFVKLQVALSALFTPNPRGHPLGVDFPVRLDTAGRVVAAPARARWTAWTPEGFVRRERAGLGRLRAIGFDVGRSDGLVHIPVTLRRFSVALAAAGIAHTFEEYDGTHGRRIPERIRTSMLPFLTLRMAAD